VKALLGPAVMMDLDAAEHAARTGGSDPAPPAPDDFDLSKGLHLLDDRPQTPPRAPGLGGGAGDESGPALMMGDTSKLRLGGQDDRSLQLDVAE
jgi:hypothetical protein